MKERINKVIKFSKMNPSEFADYIGISRASINHILNGRNNPSLDVVLKILTKFDTINSNWLLHGREPMYESKGTTYLQQKTLFDERSPVSELGQVTDISAHPKENRITTPLKEANQPVMEQLIQKTQVQKKIIKILIFYSDNTFDSLSPDF
jgi:DNA-binding XRE family transcriptional regulator